MYVVYRANFIFSTIVIRNFYYSSWVHEKLTSKIEIHCLRCFRMENIEILVLKSKIYNF